MCNARVGGVVRGSVSIMKAKKNRGDERKNLWRKVKENPPDKTRLTTRVTMAEAKNAYTKSVRKSLRVISHPPIRTGATIHGVPIHQLAERPRVSDVMTTATAAGLKTCFLYIAKIYFEAMEMTEAQSPSEKKVRSEKDLIGVMIKTKMSAVIYTDSIFVGILKTFAKRVLVTQHIKVI